ncbi:MAG: hypothetical protein A2X46_17325 [Lentisphaerae bacterium GWF2_57_35]|nr:MAG: hypothetical protein A2X46_17325 [Lentisphaerae bacterium GWF2_57_35]
MNYRSLVNTLVVGLCIALTNSPTMLSLGAGIYSDNQQADAIALDPEVQQEISRTVAMLSSGTIPEETVQNVVQEFKGFKNRTSQELLLQVLAVYGGKDEYRSNPKAEMSKRLLLSSLLQDMTSFDIVASVGPKYEQAINPKLQKSLRHALDTVAFKNGNVDPDFDAFSSYIEQNKNRPPQKLVAYMYGCNPQAAALSMARIYGDKDAEADLANKLKNDPKAVLQTFASRSEWWARLYVAEMMKKNPQLRDVSLIEKLTQDPHPLIRKTIVELNAKR